MLSLKDLFLRSKKTVGLDIGSSSLKLIEIVDLPSPYKHKPGLLPHLRITDAGQARLAP